MGNGDVVPLGRRRADRLPAPDRRVHPRVRRAAPAARDLVVEQSAGQRERYDAAVIAQRHERLLRDGVPVPARITLALGEREGPGVDLAVGTFEGNPVGDVDAWEDPDDPRLPAGEQVRLLAKLTGYGIGWFYEPYVPLPGPVWVCWSGGQGCEQVSDGGVVPPGRQPGQGVLPGMPAPVEAQRPARARPVAARPEPECAPANSQDQQMVLPVGRLADAERAALKAQLAKARERWR